MKNKRKAKKVVTNQQITQNLMGESGIVIKNNLPAKTGCFPATLPPIKSNRREYFQKYFKTINGKLSIKKRKEKLGAFRKTEEGKEQTRFNNVRILVRRNGNFWEIFKRDGNKCSQCEKTSDLTIHHKDGNGRKSKKPNNDPENLITLCRKCHGKVHGEETKQRLSNDNLPAKTGCFPASPFYHCEICHKKTKSIFKKAYTKIWLCWNCFKSNKLKASEIQW